MRHDPLFMSWTVRCASAEAARRLRDWVANTATPDLIVSDVVRAFPNGTEARMDEPHRLGEYFVSVRVLPGPPEAPSAFRILFHRRPDAGRFWKDFMAQLLRAIRGASATTTLDYRGDEEPLRVKGDAAHPQE